MLSIGFFQHDPPEILETSKKHHIVLNSFFSGLVLMLELLQMLGAK